MLIPSIAATASRHVLVGTARTARLSAASFSSTASPLLRGSQRRLPVQCHSSVRLSSLAFMSPTLEEDADDGSPSSDDESSSCDSRGLRRPRKGAVHHHDSRAPVVDIEEAHFQALCRGESTYTDPQTGFTVFTELLHLKRGTCCGNLCRHCPYGYENVRDVDRLALRRPAKVRSGDVETAQAMVRAILDGNPVRDASTVSSSLSGVVSGGTGDNATATTNRDRPARVAPKKNVPYTRGGDRGTSQLGTGERRSKCDCNFEALGTVDELCSVVGVAHAQLMATGTRDDGGAVSYGELPERLLDVMSRLFDVGSHVAKPRVVAARNEAMDGGGDQGGGEEETTQNRPKFVPNGIGDGVDSRHIDELEEWINEMTEILPELMSFVLPTGAPAAAQLHVARTVCRRAERRLVPLVVEEETCDPNALRYLNRLSDFFFVAARYVNYCEGQEEIQYRREANNTNQRERVHRSLQG